MPGRKKRQPVDPQAVSTPEARVENLPRMATMFQSVQRDRVGLERALGTRGHPDPEANRILEQLRLLEDDTVRYLTRGCEENVVWPWLQNLKGIGPRLGGMLIGLIDIEKADTVSALYRYAGFAVVCGAPRSSGGPSEPDEDERDVSETRRQCRRPFGPDGRCPIHGVAPGISEQRRKGDDLHFNIKLKKTCYLVARSFMFFQTAPYYDLYVTSKAYYKERHPGWPLGRQDLAARRRMIKLFLSHLWLKWREARGLPVGLPYPQARLGHTGYVPPPE